MLSCVLSCVLVVCKGSWLNGFVYNIRESMDIVNTKVFNTPFRESYCRHDHPLISALVVEVGRVQSISEEPHPRIVPLPPPFELVNSPFVLLAAPFNFIIRSRNLPYTHGCFIYPNSNLPQASPLTSISPLLVVQYYALWLICARLAVSLRDGLIPYYRGLVEVVVGWDLGRI